MKIPIFPGKYHQNGGFSWAMLVYRRVIFYKDDEGNILLKMTNLRGPLHVGVGRPQIYRGLSETARCSSKVELLVPLFVNDASILWD